MYDHVLCERPRHARHPTRRRPERQKNLAKGEGERGGTAANPRQGKDGGRGPRWRTTRTRQNGFVQSPKLKSLTVPFGDKWNTKLTLPTVPPPGVTKLRLAVKVKVSK